MNSLTLLVIALVWFAFGYFVYSKYLEKRIVRPNNKNKTPAYTVKNNIDYKPTKSLFLFGHHFASIAGAGPIIGPILAVSYFGWFFVALWILIGSVIIGAVHDYFSLVLSVRHKGEGMARLSERLSGKTEFYLFSFLLWCSLMLIVTAFSVSAAQSFIQVPQLVIPVFGMMVTSIFLGIIIYKFKAGKLISTLVAIILLVLFVYLGMKYPITLPFSAHASQLIWIAVLFVYCIAASVSPVWLLLQPRGYISLIGLFSFLALGLASIVVARPEINAVAIIPSSLWSVPLWPILFITIACGAVSGFHALVSSGTTSKEISKETDMRPIGFGGMIAEGLVAIVVLIFVSAGLRWTGLQAGNIEVFNEVLNSGWIFAFGKGFANIVHSAFPFFNVTVLLILGSLVVNMFITTSLDAATRIGRMVSSEALPKKSWLNNNFILTVLILVPAFILAVTNSYSDLWRMFGSSNQLIAAIVLFLISIKLTSTNEPRRYTLIPGLFMMVTTIAALLYGLFNDKGYFFNGNILLMIVSFLLIVFALTFLFKIVGRLFKRENKSERRALK